MRPFAYVVQSEKSARQAIAALWSAALQAGWTVLGDYDLSGLVPEDEAGIELKSLDICRPELARPLVRVDPLTALCMPCNVLVRSEGGRTTIAALRPGVVLPELFPEAAGRVADLPAAVDAELRRIVDEAA